MPNGFITADNACLYHNDQIRYIVCSSDLVTLISDCFAAQANLKQIYFLSPNAPALKIGDGRGYTFVDSVNSTVPNSNVTINYAKFSEGWTSGDPNSAWSWAGIFNPNNYSNYKNKISHSGFQQCWLGKTWVDIMPEVYETFKPINKGGSKRSLQEIYNLRLDYMNGMSKKDLSTKYDYSLPNIRRIIRLERWKRKETIRMVMKIF